MLILTLFFVDAEILERSEEKTEETDVEEQFSPLSKGSPSKQVFSFSETTELDFQAQMLHSEQSYHRTQLSEDKHSETTTTKQTEEVHRQSSEKASMQHKELIYAQESFEQYEEEKALFTERREVTEETASYHHAEVSEIHSLTTTISCDETDVKKTPTETVKSEERTEHSVREEETYHRLSVFEETTKTEFREPASPENETERVEQFLAEEKETTTVELLSKKGEGAAESESEAGQAEESKASRLAYMAFDNMGFTEEDISTQSQSGIHRQLSKQDTREISPEDLEEKPYTFDFPDDYKQELEAQRHYESTYTEAASIPVEEEEEDWTMESQQKSDVVLSYEETADDAGTYLIEVEEKEIPPEDLSEPSKAVPEHTQPASHDAHHEESTPVGITSGQVAEVSSESSSDNDVEVFDESTGTYVRMPWEIAHQYKRQFSESYMHQEKKVSLQQNKSIDMGTFYRREDSASYPSVSFIHEEQEPDELPKKSKVTFDLEDKPEKIPEEQAVETEKVSEPHDQIEHAHEEEVFTTIQESRQQVKEELAKDTGFDSDYLDTPLSAGGATAAALHFESAAFQPTDEMASSYSTTESSLEQSIERKTSSETEEVLEIVKTVSTEPVLCVVSMESRLAQQELLQEMADERDRSVSPSSEDIPTSFKTQVVLQSAIAEEPEPEPQTVPMVPASFPMAVHTLGKSLADNEIYESSETERDSTEEKLSPIDEGPGVDDIDDDDLPAKSVASEKRVTFQTDTLSTPRASEQSTDEFKMSTSSSEMSVEPTLLAASYELDTGRVCHVVSAFDISPDSVEKKLTPTAPAKSILSSPEDDVFETDASLLHTEAIDTPTRDESEDLTVTKQLSSDFVPSPPASTPRDDATIPTHTAVDLAEASSVLEHMKTEVTEDDDQEAAHTVDESTVQDDEPSSPFEMMSPSELKETTDAASYTLHGQMVASVESAASGSSFAEVMVSDVIEDVMTNGPTEVDYVAEYDADLVKEQVQTDYAEVKEQLEEAIESESETEEQEEEEESAAAAMGWTTEEDKVQSGAEATLSELQLPPGTDFNVMSTSDQTLYGLEMPSDETATMSASLQRDLMVKSETDQDSDQTQPPTEVTFRTDEQVSDQVETSAEMRESALFEGEGVTSADATPIAQIPDEQQAVEGREDEPEQEETTDEGEPEIPHSESPVLEEAEDEPYHLDPGSVYPGKRALEIQIPVEGDELQFLAKDDEQEVGELGRDAYEDEPAPERRLEDDFEVEDENLLGEAAGGEEEFMEQEAEEIEYMEKPEEELLRLKDSKPDSEDEEGEEAQQQTESIQKTGFLDVQGYDDLERPLSPTPDAFRQTFFGGEDEKETESPAQPGAEEDIEKTASHFVESILEDVKEKVQSMTAEKAATERQEGGEDKEEDAAVEEDIKLDVVEPEEADLPEAEQQKDDTVEEEDEFLPMPPTRSQQTKTTVLMKQVSEDIPGITITEHMSGADIDEIEDEVVDETDYPVSQEQELRDQCVPEEEEDEEPKKAVADDRVDGAEELEELYFAEPSIDTEMQFEMTFDQTEGKEEKKAQGSSFLAESDPASAHTFASVAPLPHRDVFSAPSSKVEAGDGSDEEELQPIEADLRMQDYAEQLSPEDHGDSSSVDSFATVVAADAEEEDEDEDEGDVEDRLAEIASMSSSFHSDMQVTQAELDERFEESDDDEVKRKGAQEWPKPKEPAKTPELSSSTESSDRYDSKDNELSSSVESDRYTGKETELSSSVESDRYGSNVEMSSSVESDRYEFVDRAALSVITELSEEEQFEMIEKEDAGNETGPESDPQEQFPCSPPEGPSQSPGFGSTRYFTRPLHEKDDASVSSSLLEFERLEKQMGNSGSSSIDTSDKESFGGSYDERKHHYLPGSSFEEKKFEYGSFDEKKLLRYKREMERDDISTTSSLAEFEKLERQIDQQGSSSSVEDKFTPESKSSGGKSGSGSGSGSVAGSVSSLAEFEKLEAEMATDSDDRRSSMDSSLQRRSETSSLASLNEFERLERDMLANNELEAEAQKIVSYLEAGSLDSGRMFYYSSSVGSVGYSSSDISDGEAAKQETDKDSLEDKEAVEQDSLSEGEDKEGELDSLDGDTSEMTEMTSSVIFAGPEQPAAQAGASHDMDADSLAGECIMQLSSDSLVLSQQMRTSDSSKFDTDSLLEQEDIMVRSVDSLEQEKYSDKCDQDSLQEDIMHTSADSLELVQVEEQIPENLMLMSVESAHWSMGSSGGTMCRSEESHTDSHDFMQVSAESLEDLKSSLTEQTLKSQLIKSSEFVSEGASIEVMHHTLSSGSTKVTKTQSTKPFLDDDGNAMESSGYSQDDDDEDDVKESPFMQWGPYKEEKKVYTMAEWEALKKERLRERAERSGSSSPQPASDKPGGTLSIVLVLL